MYWLTGHPLPLAFHHHARDVYEKILLHCMTADGFFATCNECIANIVAERLDGCPEEFTFRIGDRTFRTIFANILPNIEGEDWERFKRSISKEIFEPIIVDEHDNLIDGIQRLRAAAESRPGRRAHRLRTRTRAAEMVLALSPGKDTAASHSFVNPI